MLDWQIRDIFYAACALNVLLNVFTFGVGMHAVRTHKLQYFDWHFRLYRMTCVLSAALAFILIRRLHLIELAVKLVLLTYASYVEWRLVKAVVMQRDIMNYSARIGVSRLQYSPCSPREVLKK